ncbi:MAG: hypothetical protein J6S67_16400 [Methanobrevibacter sp.]|nr:hypothetical protein [Methanobrevibacter sp.]
MSFFDKYEQVFGKKEEAPAQVNTDELRKIIREEIDAAFAGFEATTDTITKTQETPEEKPEEIPEEEPEKEEEVE